MQQRCDFVLHIWNNWRTPQVEACFVQYAHVRMGGYATFVLVCIRAHVYAGDDDGQRRRCRWGQRKHGWFGAILARLGIGSFGIDFVCSLMLFGFRRQKAMTFYVPKLETEEEAAYLKDLITRTERAIHARQPLIAMLCRAVVMLCRAVVMLCRAVVMLCRAMPCRAMPCHAVPCHAMPCRAILCHAVPR